MPQRSPRWHCRDLTFCCGLYTISAPSCSTHFVSRAIGHTALLACVLVDMPCTVDHVSVPVPLRLFSLRVARVNIDGTTWVLGSQVKEACPAVDVDRLVGLSAGLEARALLVAGGDLHPSTTRAKLGGSMCVAAAHA